MTSSGCGIGSHKDQVCAPQEPREQTSEAFEHLLGFDPRRDQAGGRPRPAQTAQGDNDRHHHEGDGLAAALGPRLLCGCGAQETRLDPDIGEGRGRARLSCACRTAVQIEAEDLRATGRLARQSSLGGVISGLGRNRRHFRFGMAETGSIFYGDRFSRRPSACQVRLWKRVSVCPWLQTAPRSDHHGYSRPS
jgi:hypothetical protein